MLRHAASLRHPHHSCTGSRPCVLPARILPSMNPSRRTMHVVMRASGSSDPYAVFGLAPGAESNEVNRAYTKLKYANRGNTAELRKIEDAHSAIMLQNLSARMKGGSKVSKEIKYADTEVLFPWRPKRWDGTPKFILIVGAVQLGMMAFALQQPSMSKVVGCMLLGIVGNFFKQNAINPPPKDPNYATEEEQSIGGKNFVRAVLLALLATLLGVSLLSVPEFALSKMKATQSALLGQYNVPALLVSAKVAAAAIGNWIMSSYYY